jgi:hypothetical protein
LRLKEEEITLERLSKWCLTSLMLCNHGLKE